MKTNSITEQLLQGSHQINLWRGEIDELVKLLIGLVRETHLHDDFDIPCNKEQTSIWSIKHDDHRLASIDFIIRPWEGECCIYSSDGRVIPPGHQVQVVRATLDDLVMGLLRIFPVLDKRWKFLLDAVPKVENQKPTFGL